MLRESSSTEEFLAEDPSAVRAPPGAAAIHRMCGIYTQTHIVDEILDQVGWSVESDLRFASLLEPAAGDGAFIVAAAARLIKSLRLSDHPITVATLKDRIRAFEIHPREALRAKQHVYRVLSNLEVPRTTAKACAESWIIVGDFLLSKQLAGTFTHIVGNPPYSRWSKLPKSLRRKYERELPSRMTKGDIFLPFLDLSIGYLASNGKLGFLCSDRWKYMAFAESFREERLPYVSIEVDRTISSHDAYRRRVDIYASIIVLKKRVQSLRRRHSKRERTLSDAGYVVRVGPALGCNAAYVVEPENNNVESSLLVPWVEARDVREGSIQWSGKKVIVLHDADGRLRSLTDHPKLAARLRSYRHLLRARAIVRAGAPWYRPIDRVIANDWREPKLLIPELAKMPRVAIDRSGAIPSHGVYAIFGGGNDLESLYEALKNGGLAKLLEHVAPKVKGGYFRCYRRFLEQMTL